MDTKRVPNCAILGCLQQFKVKRHYFKFPKEQDRWLKWVEGCKRFDLLSKGPQYSSDNMRLCHLHFEEKLYRINKFRARLHPDAVPTLLLGPDTKQEDNRNEVTEQNVSSEKQELHSNICTKETIKAEDKNSNTCAEEAIKVEENNNICAEEAITFEEENSNICVEEAVKVEEENSNICAEEAITFEEKNSNICVEEVVKVEEETSNICMEEPVKVEEGNSNAKTSEIILPTCQSAASNLAAEITKPGTSAVKPGLILVVTHTKKMLDDSIRIKKLNEHVKKLRAKIRALYAQNRRLRMKKKKKKPIITSRQEEYNNLRELSRKLLPENLNRLLAAQIDAQYKRKRGRRYDSQSKEFALSLFFSSPRTYKELEKSMALPSIRTLQLFTQKNRESVSRN